MSKDFVRTRRGFNIGDGEASLIAVDAVPGSSGLSSTVNASTIAIGSAGTAVEGDIFIKTVAGTGLDKWQQVVDLETLTTQLAGLNVAFDPKDSVRVKNTSALPAFTPAGSGPGKTITMDAPGIVTFDSEDLTAANGYATGDRVFVDLEGIHNGVYTITTLSDAGTALVLTRATDFDGDPNGEVSKGAEFLVEEGTANANTRWTLISPIGTAVVDTDALVFTLSLRIGEVSALQAEVDAIEVSLGSAINGDGTFNGFTGTNHINSATSFTNAHVLLDAEIGADLTANGRTNNPVVTGAALNVNIENLDNAIGSDAQLTVLTRTLGQLSLAASLYANLDSIDAFQGEDTDLTPVARTVGPVSLSNTNLANFDQIDAAIGADPTAEARTFNPISPTLAANTNIDRLDAALGGDLTSTFNVSNSQSVNDNISALDAQVNSNTQTLQKLRVRTQTAVPGGGLLTDVDSVVVDNVQLAVWHVIVQETANPDKRETWQISASHNGTVSADATLTDSDDLHNLRFGGGNNVAGLDYEVVLSGAGPAQVMKLQIAATNAVTVTTYRESFDSL